MYHVDICKCKNITFINPAHFLHLWQTPTFELWTWFRCAELDTMCTWSQCAGWEKDNGLFVSAGETIKFNFIHISLRNTPRVEIFTPFCVCVIKNLFWHFDYLLEVLTVRKKRGCFNMFPQNLTVPFCRIQHVRVKMSVSSVLRDLRPRRLGPVCVPAGFNSCFYCSVSLSRNFHQIFIFKVFRKFWNPFCSFKFMKHDSENSRFIFMNLKEHLWIIFTSFIVKEEEEEEVSVRMWTSWRAVCTASKISWTSTTSTSGL